MLLTINVGGGPTDDKPEVVASPLRNQNILSIFLNLRVTDFTRCSIHHRAKSPYDRAAVLHAPPGRIPNRSRTNDYDGRPSRFVRVTNLCAQRQPDDPFRAPFQQQPVRPTPQPGAVA